MTKDQEVDFRLAPGQALNYKDIMAMKDELDKVDVSGFPEVVILYAFSGPSGRADGFEAWARRAGASRQLHVKVIMCDLISGIDLADELAWQGIYDKLTNDEFHASLWSPPCSTFSVVRHLPGGPPVLRGPAGPDLYGLPRLKPKHKEQVRMGTLLAIRAARGIEAQRRGGRPWILESPSPAHDCASIFSLPEIISAGGAEATSTDFVQCMLGADSMKKTRLLSSHPLSESLSSSCSHDRRWWRLPPTGEWIHSSHPPLRGRHRAVSPTSWGREGPQPISPEYLTKQAAAYPSALNAFLAAELVSLIEAPVVVHPPASEARRHTSLKAPAGFARTGKWGNALVAVDCLKRSSPPSDEVFDSKRRATMTTHLRPVDENMYRKENEEAAAIGGMRKPQRSLTKLPLVVEVGRRLRTMLENAVSQYPRLAQSCLDALGNKEKAKDIPQDHLEAVRILLASVLKTENIEPIKRGYFSTEIRAHLLDSWRSMTKDPDWAVTKWLVSEGVPAGLARHPEDCGIFPRTPVDGLPTDSLHTDPSEFLPYASVESDDDAWAQVQQLVQKGWLLEFDTWDQLKHFLGADPVLSKFGLVLKERAGIVKKRLILDAKASGISEVASKRERILLPRILDITHNVLNLQAVGPEEIELFILDFADAFWLLPLAPDERRWFTSRLRGKYFCFLRNAQGSRNAPLGWGRLAALLGRLTQSIFGRHEALTEIYTDDPCLCLRGSRAERSKLIAMTCILWLSLGFPLSWAKGCRGPRADWIGAHFSITNSRQYEERGITVRIMDDLFQSAQVMLVDVLGLNVVAKKKLRQLTGKLSNIANLLWPWRPFLRPLYGVIYNEDSTAPLHCVWVKAIQEPLRWFQHFFRSSGGMIERCFSLECYLNVTTHIDMVIDASPWGIAGVLLLDGRAQEYFSDALSTHDVEIFKHQIGESDGQQTWEALAALVAIRVWRSRWQKHRVRLTVKGDNVAMLTLIVNLRPKSAQLQLIGQELALEFCHFSFVPIVAKHLPGVANTVADALSRLHQPGSTKDPNLEYLKQARSIQVPAREISYYQSAAQAPKKSG